MHAIRTHAACRVASRHATQPLSFASPEESPQEEMPSSAGSRADTRTDPGNAMPGGGWPGDGWRGGGWDQRRGERVRDQATDRGSWGQQRWGGPHDKVPGWDARLQMQNRVLVDLLTFGTGCMKMGWGDIYDFSTSMCWITRQLAQSKEKSEKGHKEEFREEPEELQEWRGLPQSRLELRFTPRFAMHVPQERGFLCGYNLHHERSVPPALTGKVSHNSTVRPVWAFLMDNLRDAPAGTGVILAASGPQAVRTAWLAFAKTRGSLRGGSRDAYCTCQAALRRSSPSTAPGQKQNVWPFVLVHELSIYVVESGRDPLARAAGPETKGAPNREGG